MPRSTLALALVCLLAAQASLAQPAPPPSAPPTAPSPPAAPAADAGGAPESTDKKTEARAHFDSAIALFEESAWDPALAEFQRSLELFPTRSATKNAALCLRKLQRYDEALEMFERLLHDFPDLPAPDRAVAEQAIRELNSLIGFVGLTGAVPGARVVIDGRERGTTPVSRIRVGSGTHFVRVIMEGFVPFETQVRVAGGQTSVVEVHLSALTQGGRLHVTEQSGQTVNVVVDTVVVGKTPWEGTLSVGEHTVWLKGPGNLGTQPASAPVRLNDVTTLTLAAEELNATLRVEPKPVSASVAIDGVVVGRGVWDGRLHAGSHRIEVALEGFLPRAQQLTVSAKQHQVIGVELERDSSSPIWQARNPPRFFVEIDGALGLSPSIGGEVTSGCSGSCSATLPLGFEAVAHVGYQLSSGLGFAIDAGYLLMQQKVTGRATVLHPKGLPENEATADDALKLGGLLVGASAQFHRGESIPVLFRIGAGVLLGKSNDARSGTGTTVARTVNPGAPNETTYPAAQYTFDTSESNSASYLYLAPEARVSWRIGQHFELSGGVSALVLIALGQPKWSDANPIILPDDATKYHVGALTFGSQSTAGSTIVVLSPGIGGRYEF